MVSGLTNSSKKRREVRLFDRRSSLFEREPSPLALSLLLPVVELLSNGDLIDLDLAEIEICFASLAIPIRTDWISGGLANNSSFLQSLLSGCLRRFAPLHWPALRNDPTLCIA
jgi:hypothetical protein